MISCSSVMVFITRPFAVCAWYTMGNSALLTSDAPLSVVHWDQFPFAPDHWTSERFVGEPSFDVFPHNRNYSDGKHGMPQQKSTIAILHPHAYPQQQGEFPKLLARSIRRHFDRHSLKSLSIADVSGVMLAHVNRCVVFGTRRLGQLFVLRVGHQWREIKASSILHRMLLCYLSELWRPRDAVP